MINEERRNQTNTRLDRIDELKQLRTNAINSYNDMLELMPRAIDADIRIKLKNYMRATIKHIKDIDYMLGDYGINTKNPLSFRSF